MDAIHAIDTTSSATLDAMQALLSGEALPAPAEPAPPEPAPATPRVEADHFDGRTTLAALAAEAVQRQHAPVQVSAAPTAPAAPPATPTAQAPADAAARVAAGSARIDSSLAAAAASLSAGAQASGAESAARPVSARLELNTTLAPAASTRPLDSQIIPIPLTPLHIQPAWLQRSAPLPDSGVARKNDAPRSPDEPDRGPEDEHDTAADDQAPQPEAGADDAPAAETITGAEDPAYITLREWLVDGAQNAALRELQLRRRVLLIVPSDARSKRRSGARVHLLAPYAAAVASSGGTAHTFAARWWPGAGTRPDWTSWRLHREAGLCRLKARQPSPLPAGAIPLLLRLGPSPASVLDAGSACLDIADLRRFEHALGSQWSVIALLCLRTSP